MKIIIGADFIPTSSNLLEFVDGKMSDILDEELKQLIASADFRMFNLEAPIVDEKMPIMKCGPSFAIPTLAINGYKEVNVNLFTLGNNHIFDQGSKGIESTIKVLENNKIDFVGISATNEDVHEGRIFTIGEYKIGVYSCCEHEFSVATKEHCGATPFELDKSYDCVSRLKKECDYIIVLFHGGKEHFRFPSPRLQKFCKMFVNYGADLVVCQHSHCIGCEEIYKDKSIVYGQGNFLFDNSNNEFWKDGLLIEVSDDFVVTYHPIVKEGRGVRLAKNDEKEEILSKFIQRSKMIQDDDFVKNQYDLLARETINNYLLLLHGKRTIFYRIINRLLGRKLDTLILKKYNIKELLTIRNVIECEAHQELLLQGIDCKIKDLEY